MKVRKRLPRESKKSGLLRQLRFALAGHGKKYFALNLWALANGVFFGVAQPMSIKFLFDEGILKKNFRLFLMVALIALGVFTLWRASEWAWSLFSERVRNRLTVTLSERMLSAYHEVPYQEIVKAGSGYFVSRTLDDAKGVSRPLVDTTAVIVDAVATLIAGASVLLLLSWRLTLVFLVVAPVLQLLSRRFAGRIRTQSRQEQEEEGKLRSVATRIIGAYKTTRVFELRKLVHRTFTDQFSKLVSISYERYKTSRTYRTISSAITSWIELGVLIAGGFEILNGRLTFGGFLAFTSAFWIVLNGMNTILRVVPDVSKLQAGIDRLSELEEFGVNQSVRHTSERVSLDDVCYSFGELKVLRDVSLDLAVNDRLLLTGPNGSGKSTLAHILAGLLPPTEGAISVPPRLSASIEPVTFPPASLSEIISVSDQGSEASLAETLAKTLGLEALLAKDYEELSAGEKKKFSVLMTLLQEADLYILDEPLANVDVESKEAIMQAVIARTRDRILIVIMHGDAIFESFFSKWAALIPGTEGSTLREFIPSLP